MLKIKRVKVVAKDKDGKVIKLENGKDKTFNNYYVYEEHLPKIKVPIVPVYDKNNKYSVKNAFKLLNTLVDSQEIENEE